MTEQSGANPRTVERYEALLRDHLLFYDALRLRERRPEARGDAMRRCGQQRLRRPRQLQQQRRVPAQLCARHGYLR